VPGIVFALFRRQGVMSMKRFLIFSILIVFTTMSCAGPSKTGWRKPDFRQDEFERDREECIQRVGNHDLDPEVFAERLEKCLAERNYTYFPAQAEVEPPQHTSSIPTKVLEVFGDIIKMPIALAYLTIAPFLMITFAILGEDTSSFIF
jgi:hypothetical protein